MPSSYTNVVLQKPNWFSSGSWTPQDFREAYGDIITPGVVGINDFLVSVSSGLTLSVAAGVAYIKGGNAADQGMYRQYAAGANTIAVAAAHATLPRLDQIILRVLDADHDSNGGSYQGLIEVIPGTATSGATLANRTGAAALGSILNSSQSYILLSDVLVPAAAGSLVAGNLGDQRKAATLNLRVPRVRAYRTANQSIPDATDTAISFTASRYNNDRMWNSATNPTRFTCITPGLYTFKGNIEWAVSAIGIRSFWIRLNGTTDIGDVRITSPNGTSVDRHTVAADYEMVAGDYVEFMVRQNTGGALNVAVNANYSPECSAVRLAA